MSRENAARLLNIPVETTSEEVITKAYKKLAIIHHPDKPTGSVKNFQILGEAKDVMMKPYRKSTLSPTDDALDELYRKMEEYLRYEREREKERRYERMARIAQFNSDVTFAIIMVVGMMISLFFGKASIVVTPLLITMILLNKTVRKLLAIYYIKKMVKKM